MKLLVNGEVHEVPVDPDTALLYVLRNDLGLVGTRFGCGLGLCGACTVLLDGRPAAACDTPLWSVGERAVTTVESLGPPERPGRLPQAILDHQAAQCGYCVSGMLMTATSLLAERPDADEATVRAALDGHLCRCGAHNRIVRAILDAAGRPAPSPSPVGTVVVAGPTVQQAGGLFAGPAEEPPSASLRANPKPSRWLAFEPDRTVTVRTGKVEIGQGILTALAQVAAAELGVAPTRIRMAGADTTVSPDEGLTAGSHSVEESGLALRLVGAQVRERCRAAAAERLGDPVGEVGLMDGAFTGPSGTLTYWDLPTATLLDRDAEPTAPSPLDRDAEPTAPSLLDRDAELTAPNPGHDAASVSRAPVRDGGADAGGRVGAPLPRVDLPAKVTGGRRYLADLTWPDVLHARVARPPALGSTLVEARTGAAAGLAGVRRVVVDGSLLAVLADREEIAIRAAERLRRDSRWSPGTPLPADLREMLRDRPLETVTLLDTAAAGAAVAGTAASADAAAPDASAMSVAATYGRGALAHASIGTATAVALDRDGVLQVWTHSQGVFALRAALARALGRPEDAIVVRHAEHAGCYGHNGADDVAYEAAYLAGCEPGRPVRVVWSRAEELTWSPLGAPMEVDLRAALSPQGTVVAWSHDVRSFGHIARPGAYHRPMFVSHWLRDPGQPMPVATEAPVIGVGRNAVPGYDFPNLTVRAHRLVDPPVRTSALRSLGAHLNVFAIESFVDELAAVAGRDPLDFRLAHLADPRGRAVLELAARRAGWSARPGPDAALGLGYARYKNTSGYCAVVAEAELTEGGSAIRVRRLSAAVDVGRPVSVDGVVNQVEGGALQAMSWSTVERVGTGPDGITSDTWLTYPILTFTGAPEVDVAVVASGAPSLGAGEIAMGPTAGAIANAVFALTGARVRQLPLTREAIVAALEA